MSSLNKIMIIGNLGRDPEMHFTSSGSAVTSFTVAVNRRYNSREGEPRDETEWFRVSCWDRLAEIANEYLSKGRQVFVEGRVGIHSWSDSHTGEKRAQMEITASNLVLLGQGADYLTEVDQKVAQDSAHALPAGAGSDHG
jgi:single-strand DNA-binding protein